MRTNRLLCIAALATSAIAQQAAAPLTDQAKEEFLRNAKVIRTQGAKKGITGTIRATLSDGVFTHDASIQSIDESKARFESATGTEINFRDSFKYNIAGYKLDRMLGLNMTPPSVERRHAGKSSSFTWWVDDVLMDEGDRFKKKINAPDPDKWNCQMMIVRVFDQLIFNMDRNLQNLLIDKDWNLWMIDHTRAFRLHKSLKEPKNLVKCDRQLLEKLKTLNHATLREKLAGSLNEMEMQGLLARRDIIVKTFEQRGGSALYDAPRRVD
jgi:hypothetical protein